MEVQSEIQKLINRLARLEAKQAELNALYERIAEESAEVLQEIAPEVERLRKLRHDE